VSFSVQGETVGISVFFYIFSQLVIGSTVEPCMEGAVFDLAIKHIVLPNIEGIRTEVLIRVVAQPQNKSGLTGFLRILIKDPPDNIGRILHLNIATVSFQVDNETPLWILRHILVKEANELTMDHLHALVEPASLFVDGDQTGGNTIS
jgi:hypothetical protein